MDVTYINVMLTILNILIMAAVVGAYISSAKAQNKANRILDRQSEIMQGQVELSRSMDESNKLMAMLHEHDPLDSVSFWRALETAYDAYRGCQGSQALPESLESLIEEAGFPSRLDPLRVNNLQQFVRAHKSDWDNLGLWKSARVIFTCQYDQDSDPEIITVSNAIRHQKRDVEAKYKILVRFWEKWSPQFERIHNHLTPDPKELVTLSWLELARVRGIRYVWRPGQREFLRLAKVEWESLMECAKEDAGVPDSVKHQAIVPSRWNNSKALLCMVGLFSLTG